MPEVRTRAEGPSGCVAVRIVPVDDNTSRVGVVGRMSRLVEPNGAQVLPPVADTRQTVSSWFAYSCTDADHRTKHATYRHLAAVLEVHV